jgi:hypothetical protein
LHRSVLDFFSAAIGASFANGALGVDGMTLNGLYAGLKLLTQERGKIRRLRFGHDNLCTGIWEHHLSKFCSKYFFLKCLVWAKPLFSALQHSQPRTFCSVPFVDGSKFPQSVQKTMDPMAAIFA